MANVTISPELAKAQAMLESKRIGVDQTRTGNGQTRPCTAVEGGGIVGDSGQEMGARASTGEWLPSPGQSGRNWALANAQKALQARRDRAGLEGQVTAVNADPAIDWSGLAEQARARLNTAEHGRTRPNTDQTAAPEVETVRAYPSILAAVLKADRAPELRLWLLFRAQDVELQGYYDLEALRERFCSQESNWYISTWRYFRLLLQKGEGVFWDRHADNGRLWIRGPQRVAAAFDISRLQGKPVYLPINDLLGSIKLVKAHCFAAYESGKKSDAPISQAALRKATGTAERTQREYNKLLERDVSSHYTVTSREYNPDNVYELVEDGRTVLKFTDWLGKRHGERKKAYCAFRLPDTRSRVHEQAPKGRQRGINQTLNLIQKAEQGKSERTIRSYHPSVQAAAKAYGRNPDTLHHWPLDRYSYPPPPGAGDSVQMWECIG